jgi:hypothetical protein
MTAKAIEPPRAPRKTITQLWRVPSITIAAVMGDLRIRYFFVPLVPFVVKGF